ncbi:MAG TPA: glycerate kinase [Syntrophomonadaceae bacterium]|nr:glycerate kinase [Syntrophomonadaceae bacterium]
MKIIAAPDSFKGSLSSIQAASAMEFGIKRANPDLQVIKVPMADGGEGTVQSLVNATGGKIIAVQVKGPLGDDIDAFYGLLGNGHTAVIEMAAASGLPLIAPGCRDPFKATTYGTGQLIKNALDHGCTEIIVGLGGSATNDGGAGMAQALGVHLLDSQGQELPPGGGSLGLLDKIDLSNIDARIFNTKIIAACDVLNPLCGPDGATYVYGPQKGVPHNSLKLLDQNLSHYGYVIERSLEREIANLPGAGAAGGLGAGIMAFLNARLEKGINMVIRLTGLEQKMADADLVITGEGRLDYQTVFGKTPFGVAATAKKYNLPVVAVAGSLGEGFETLYAQGFDSIFAISDGPITLEQSMDRCEELLASASERIVRLWMTAFNSKSSGLQTRGSQRSVHPDKPWWHNGDQHHL